MQSQPGGDRVIFLCDCNGFYAAVEILDRPELKNVPLAVAGSQDDRAGIVLAKNELAKKCGIFTTQTVWQAKKMCPGLVFVPPRHQRYSEISARVNAVYEQFTDQVEPASIDESYLDVTGSLPYFKTDAATLADRVRQKIREEIGITVSVGVSYCKIFAKMGSDYKKPDATTVITRDNYRDILWPLPIGRMLYAGKSTCDVLRKHHILTIGDLARQDAERIEKVLGKSGRGLWLYCNGVDDAPVLRPGETAGAKSVGNGMTFRRDISGEVEIRKALIALSDQVAQRLRGMDRKCRTLQVQVKDGALRVISRQMTLPRSTWLQKELADAAMNIILRNWDMRKPIRALTVTAEHLVEADEAFEQLSLLTPPNDAQHQKREKLESAVSLIRQRLGEGSVHMGMPEDEELGIKRNE